MQNNKHNTFCDTYFAVHLAICQQDDNIFHNTCQQDSNNVTNYARQFTLCQIFHQRKWISDNSTTYYPNILHYHRNLKFYQSLQ